MTCLGKVLRGSSMKRFNNIDISGGRSTVVCEPVGNDYDVGRRWEK